MLTGGSSIVACALYDIELEALYNLKHGGGIRVLLHNITVPFPNLIKCPCVQYVRASKSTKNTTMPITIIALQDLSRAVRIKHMQQRVLLGKSKNHVMDIIYIKYK